MHVKILSRICLIISLSSFIGPSWSFNASAAIAQYENNQTPAPTPTPTPAPTTSNSSNLGAAAAGAAVGVAAGAIVGDMVGSSSQSTAPTNNTVVVNQAGKPVNATTVKSGVTKTEAIRKDAVNPGSEKRGVVEKTTVTTRKTTKHDDGL